MLSFIRFLLERAGITASGEKGEYHASKYLDPFVGKKTEGIKHVLKKDTKIGDTVHPAGTEINIHSTRDEHGNRITRGKKNTLHSVVSVGDGPKIELPNSRIEKPEGIGGHNSINKYYADAFEAHTALELHKRTGSIHNSDSEHQARIAKIQQAKDITMAKIPEHMQKEAERLGNNAAETYLHSLKHNHGINAEDVHEVHWTNKGISKVLGREVSQQTNPHDLVIKTKNGKLHGTSLKAKSGTVSNNGLKTFDKNSVFNGQHTNVSAAWKGQTNGDEAARHHTESFNSGSVEEQKAHLHYLMKSHPDLHYDYTDADQKKSIPIDKHPNVIATNQASGFTAVHSGSKVRIHDDQGRHILTIEHRRPGKGRSPQANAKFGNLK